MVRRQCSSNEHEMANTYSQIDEAAIVDDYFQSWPFVDSPLLQVACSTSWLGSLDALGRLLFLAVFMAVACPDHPNCFAHAHIHTNKVASMYTM